MLVLTPGKGVVGVDSPGLLKGWDSPKEEGGEKTALSDHCKQGKPGVWKCSSQHFQTTSGAETSLSMGHETKKHKE